MSNFNSNDVNPEAPQGSEIQMSSDAQMQPQTNQQSEQPHSAQIDTTSANQNQQQPPSAQEDSMAANSVQDEQNYQFYKEYCRLYYANIILTNRLQQLLNEKKDLQFKLSRLESNRQAHEEALGMTFDITDERRKRHRRTANEIQRHYVCPVEDCPKSYGSEGSLNQHLKIKHLEYYQATVQATNAQQHIVPGVISQAAAGQKLNGLPLPKSSGEGSMSLIMRPGKADNEGSLAGEESSAQESRSKASRKVVVNDPETKQEAQSQDE